jgi:hypothetical protein
MDMSEIEDFARSLQAQAEAGQFPTLQNYAATLLRQVEAFDIDQVSKTLQEFPAMCEKLAIVQSPA